MLSSLLLLLSAQSNPVTVITNVSVVTPGSIQISQSQDVGFDKTKILFVKPTGTERISPSTTKVDGTGKFIIPGLWDMHVHLADERTLGLFTANGVTGIRVLFGQPLQLTWRKNIQTGKSPGPEMVLAGPIVDGPKPVWNGSIGVSTPDEAREAVRKIKRDGYDFVKVYSLLSRECYFAIADECKKQKIDFAGHVPHSVGILEAQAAGQRTSEHVMEIALECSDHPEAYRAKIESAAQEGLTRASEVSRELAPAIIGSYSLEKQANLISELAKGPMWQCPTLVVLRNIANLDNSSINNENQNKYVSPFMKVQWDPKNDFRFKNRKAEDWERSRANYNSIVEFTRKMIAAKVNILAGTDCLNPYVYAGYSLHEELELLVKAGMTPTDALASATINPAKFFGRDKSIGTISEGSVASFVLLDANPLEDIRNSRRISAVAQNGKFSDRKALDKMLKDREY